jgi:hypothetical protein
MIRARGRTLDIDGKEHLLEYPILGFLRCRDRVVVLFDPDADDKAFGQFRNLVGLGVDGSLLWRAELPTSTSGDCYYRMEMRNGKLLAFSVYSYVCTLDPKDGTIVERQFVK